MGAFFDRNFGCPIQASTSRRNRRAFPITGRPTFSRRRSIWTLISILPTRGSSRTYACAETRRLPRPTAALRLDGDELDLVALTLDGRPLAAGDYRIEPDGALVIADVPDSFVLEIRTRIVPERNTALSGLYISGGNFCTQCEPEGFRRITYFLDRPDVMARYARDDARRQDPLPGAAVERQSGEVRRTRRMAGIGRAGSIRTRSRHICSRSLPAT